MLCDIFNFNDLINSDSVFWFCALAGTGMFFIQFLLNIFGISDQDSLNPTDNTLSDHTDFSDVKKVKWLSMQAMTGFLMMFGWTAITCQNEFGFQNTTTIGISIVVGFFTALIIRAIFKFSKRFHSSGSIYRIEDAIGKEAYVYQRIPKDGMGKISVTLQNFTHEIDAISHDHEELPSFMRVRIIKKNDDSTVVVIPL